MSLVLWYSIVAKWCLRSYSLYLISSGLFSFFAVRFLPNVHILHWSCGFGNRFLLLFSVMYVFSIAKVESVSFRILAFPLLHDFALIVPFSKSMFLSVVLCSSIGLSPVSFSSVNIVAHFLLNDDMIMLASSTLGTFGNLSSF